MVDPDMVPIIIDCGAFNTKCGYSSDSPQCVFRTVIGRVKFQIYSDGDRRETIGNLSKIQKGLDTKLSFPIERRQIKNWYEYEKILHHALYTELKVTPCEHPTLVTEAPLTPKSDREKLTNTMFETFNVPALYIANQSVLSLFASGRHNGLVLDCGYQISHSVPIYGGSALPGSTFSANVGGKDVTERLEKLLNRERLSMSEKSKLRRMKEDICYVSTNFREEMENPNHTTTSDFTKDGFVNYTLSDNTNICVGGERFESPEILFENGVHQIVQDSIHSRGVNQHGEHLKAEMYRNIVLGGETTRFRNMDIRLEKEVRSLSRRTSNNSVNDVKVSRHQNYSAFVGGCMMTDISSFQVWWITKDEYDDAGPSIVHRKCI